jgi:fatty-acyl-CoA synthase
MIGYYDMPAATAEAIDDAGWLHTGDLGALTATGNLRVTGRIKDMIIRGGENLFPREIEDVVAEHPAVAEVAVIGVPDEKWGEEVVAVVRLIDGGSATGDELTDFVLERMARHKRPRRWVFVDAMPVTASGKVQKFVLREQLISGLRR